MLIVVELRHFELKKSVGKGAFGKVSANNNLRCGLFRKKIPRKSTL